MQQKGLLFGAKGKSLRSIAQVGSCNHLGPVWMEGERAGVASRVGQKLGWPTLLSTPPPRFWPTLVYSPSIQTSH